MRESFEGRSGTQVQMLLASLREDLPSAARGVVVNRIAASIVVPRALRFAVYRAMGLHLETANIFYGVQIWGRSLRLGKRTFVNANARFEGLAPIIIGEDCQIGMEALFVTSHHEVRDGRISKAPDHRPIRVGDRCWIGARATVLPGVTIVDDCVIAAGAVVARDCLEPGVYAGVPARRTRGLDAA